MNQDLNKELKNSKIGFKILQILINHIGEQNAIGMPELYERVYEKPWTNRVYDTRPIRAAVTLLRSKGIAIISTTDKENGGYFLASANSEKDKYCQAVTRQAVKKLLMVAKIKGITLSSYLKALAGDVC